MTISDRRLNLGRLAIYLEPRCPLPAVVFKWARLRTTTPHYAEDGCLPYHCCIHEIDEIVTDTTYRVCFECKHVYQTADELLAAHHAHYAGVPVSVLPRFDPADLASCPLCAHDF